MNKLPLLVMYDGGAVPRHGLLFDDADELECAAEGGVRVGPLRALEMSDLQHVVVLRERHTNRL